MNRRSFFKMTIGALAAAYVAPLVSLVRHEPPITLGIQNITFKGIPLIYSQYCLPGKIYFINPTRMQAWKADTSFLNEKPVSYKGIVINAVH